MVSWLKHNVQSNMYSEHTLYLASLGYSKRSSSWFYNMITTWPVISVRVWLFHFQLGSCSGPHFLRLSILRTVSGQWPVAIVFYMVQSQTGSVYAFRHSSRLEVRKNYGQTGDSCSLVFTGLVQVFCGKCRLPDFKVHCSRTTLRIRSTKHSCFSLSVSQFCRFLWYYRFGENHLSGQEM